MALPLVPRIRFPVIAGIICASFLGCTGKSNTQSSVAAFEMGRIEDAVRTARDVSPENKAETTFLVYQYTLFDWLRSNGSTGKALESANNEIMKISPDPASVYRGGMISAKTFALFRRGDAEGARRYLSEECKRWRGDDVAACAKELLVEAIGSYYESHKKMGAVFLYESSYIFKNLVTQKAVAGEFYMGLALIEINQNQAEAVLRGMVERDQLNPVMTGQYCNFVSQTSYHGFIDCDKFYESHPPNVRVVRPGS